MNHSVFGIALPRRPFQKLCVRRPVGSLVFSIGWLLAIASPSYSNSDRAQSPETCRAYVQLLNGQPITEPADECLNIASGLVSLTKQGVSDRDFPGVYLELLGESLTLSKLVSVLQSVDASNTETRFNIGADALVSIVYAMANSGDKDRATFYANVLTDIQRQAILEVCAQTNGPCIDGPENWNLSLRLDNGRTQNIEINPTDLLFCAVRYDAYLLPLSEVLESNAVQRCLTK